MSFTSDTTKKVVSPHLIPHFPYPLNVQQQIRYVLHSMSFICSSLDGARSLLCSALTFETILGERLQQPKAGKLRKEYVIISKCYLEKVKAQHEGALPPPCIVRKDPRVPHTARRGA